MKRELHIQRFIRDHIAWETILADKPYCIQVSRDKMFGHNLVMFKYSQIDSDFHDPIVRECRGLILDEDTLEPICVPFFKFGNYGESYCPNIDWSSAFCLQKVDGCVREDTKIKTTIGDVDIKTICKDPSKYKVLTYNHQINSIEENSIDAISVKNDSAEWYEIELEDSTKLTVTGNHKIWCENLGCYRRVDELDGTEELIVK